MAAMSQFLCAIIFLGLIVNGNCQCSKDDIEIEQEATGVEVGQKPEWRVTVTNKCKCSQAGLKLDCAGFQTTENPDSDYVTVVGSLCIVSDQGNPIRPFSSVDFTYAWEDSFAFQPLSSQSICG